MPENTKNNPYFYSSELKNPNGTIKDPRALRMAKKNICYLVSVLSKIIVSNGDTSILPNKFITQILSEGLPFNDQDLGFNTKGLAKKLKFLITELSANPEAQEKFNRSLFSEALRNLFYGSAGKVDASEHWNNYRQIAPLPPRVQKTFGNQTDPQNAAFAIYADDQRMTNVLDIGKILDIIVKTDENGKFCIEPDNSITTIDPLMQAVSQTLIDLKTNPAFTSSFAKIKSEKEIVDEKLCDDEIESC